LKKKIIDIDPSFVWKETGNNLRVKMDPEAFLDLANQVAKLKMYPYFELAMLPFVVL